MGFTQLHSSTERGIPSNHLKSSSPSTHLSTKLQTSKSSCNIFQPLSSGTRHVRILSSYLSLIITVIIFILLSSVSHALKISPKPCTNAVGEEGTCMFVWECIKTEGKHLGTCVDGFLFGSCCGHNDTSNTIDEVTGDKPGEPEITSSWLSPASSSPSYPTHSQWPIHSQTSQVSSFPSSPSSSSSNWPSSHRPTQPPFIQTSHYPHKTTSAPFVSSPEFQRPSASTTSRPSFFPTQAPSTPRPQTTPKPPPPPPPAPPTPIVNNKPPPQTSSPIHGPISGPVNMPSGVQPQQQQQWTLPSTPGSTTVHTFRPPIFSIFGTHRPPATIFFKPPRPTRPTYRPPPMPVRPTTSIFQPFNPRPSPVPSFPHHQRPPISSATTPHTTTALTTTSSTTTTTTEPPPEPPLPTTTRAPLKPHFPPQINHQASPSNQISSGTSVMTHRPVLTTGTRSECGVPPLLAQAKVVGGKNSVFGSWPWQVSVRRTSFFGFSSTHRCGGAIINSQWIATAGHCVDDLLLSQIRIRVGEYDFASAMEPYPYVERGAKRKVVHPQYNFFTYENDLALVQVDEPFDFQPHVSPICLPPDNIELVGRNATVTGWGRLSEGGILPSVLQEVRVPIVSNDKCKGMFLSAGRHEYIPEIFMCAGYPEGGRDSCQGDSGGPLQVQGDDGKWFLAGIISWGIGCAEPNLPGVCTRISKFKPWIQSTVTS